MNKKIYVTMTDKYMSGWGCAAGKIDKFIVECDSWSDAALIERNAKERGWSNSTNLLPDILNKLKIKLKG